MFGACLGVGGGNQKPKVLNNKMEMCKCERRRALSHFHFNFERFGLLLRQAVFYIIFFFIKMIVYIYICIRSRRGVSQKYYDLVSVPWVQNHAQKQSGCRLLGILPGPLDLPDDCLALSLREWILHAASPACQKTPL